MNDQIERRIAGLIIAYADQAPVAVQPEAMARLVAMGGSPGTAPTAVRAGLSDLGGRGRAFALALALTAALSAGLLVAGGPMRLWQRESVTPVVAPFTGLPPIGASPSQPERGELVLSFWARMPALGWEVAEVLLYADGRLVWWRNLEGNAVAHEVFGALPPTTATIEQRLTPAGVQLVLGDVLASRSLDAEGAGHPGARPWGRIQVRIDGQMQSIGWDDAELPLRLADPGSWLPADAWADRRLLGYVPWRYAACLGPDLTATDLPRASADLLQGVQGFAGPGQPNSIGTCYMLTTDVARQLAATLDVAGLVRVHPEVELAYRVAPASEGSRGLEGVVLFLEVLPDGELLLRGG